MTSYCSTKKIKTGEIGKAHISRQLLPKSMQKKVKLCKTINCHIMIYGKIGNTKGTPTIIYGRVTNMETDFAKMYGAKIYPARIVYKIK